jgi:hypothetical protein
MLTLEGTWAAVRLLRNETTAPDGGAAPFRVTVPVDEDPPVTLLGLSVSAVSEATFMVSVVVRVAP